MVLKFVIGRANTQPTLANCSFYSDGCLCVFSDVTANSVHPGVVLTEVMRYYPVMVRCLFNMIGILFFKVSDCSLSATQSSARRPVSLKSQQINNSHTILPLFNV